MLNKIIAAILFITFVAFFVGSIIGPVLLALCRSALWLLVYPVFFSRFDCSRWLDRQEMRKAAR